MYLHLCDLHLVDTSDNNPSCIMVLFASFGCSRFLNVFDMNYLLNLYYDKNVKRYRFLNLYSN